MKQKIKIRVGGHRAQLLDVNLLLSFRRDYYQQALALEARSAADIDAKQAKRDARREARRERYERLRQG